MKKYIQCQLRIEGIHCWEDCKLDEVGYLKHLHRHEFAIEVTKKVDKLDREIEFICFKHEIAKYLRKQYWSTIEQCCCFENMSCESIASELINKFKLYACSVKEDGENGALLVNERNA